MRASLDLCLYLLGAYDEADVAFSALRVAIGPTASRAIGLVESHYDIQATRGA